MPHNWYLNIDLMRVSVAEAFVSTYMILTRCHALSDTHTHIHTRTHTSNANHIARASHQGSASLTKISHWANPFHDNRNRTQPDAQLLITLASIVPFKPFGHVQKCATNQAQGGTMLDACLAHLSFLHRVTEQGGMQRHQRS